MNHGFDHFDSSHQENFISAMLLLLMECDEAVRRELCGLFLERAGVTEWEPRLVDLGRERSIRCADGIDRRVDLWLRFPQGILVVEVKTTETWQADYIELQVERYRTGTLRNPESAVGAAVLLVPRALDKAVGTGAVTWGAVVRHLRGLESASPLAERAITHIENLVERDIGIPEGAVMNVRETARHVGALRDFLVSCVRAIDGKPQGSLWTTPGDGEPLRRDGWAWYGLSIPFSIGDETFRLGVYEYVETPTGLEVALKHPWLEMYRNCDDQNVVELEFDGNLSPGHLDELRKEFVDAWEVKWRGEKAG